MEDECGFENIEVAHLPFAHAPFRCAHSARFRSIMRTHGLSECDHSNQVIAREFYESLTVEDFSTCPYHQADWEQIAAVGCAAVDRFGPDGPDIGQLGEVIERSSFSDSDALWLDFLFMDPIKWSDGAEELVNGQSRTCAMRAAGVEKCPVEMVRYRRGE